MNFFLKIAAKNKKKINKGKDQVKTYDMRLHLIFPLLIPKNKTINI